MTIELIALSLRPFNCGGDFSALKVAVDAAKVPEFDAVLREGVRQFRRNGMLRESDVLAIQDVLNARLTEMAQQEADAIKRAEREHKADRMERWINQQLLDTDDLR